MSRMTDGGGRPRCGPDVLPYGDRALLVEVADLAAVAAVRRRWSGRPLPGQRDLVPAARTVLVVLDRRAGRDSTSRSAPAAGARRRRRVAAELPPSSCRWCSTAPTWPTWPS